MEISKEYRQSKANSAIMAIIAITIFVVCISLIVYGTRTVNQPTLEGPYHVTCEAGGYTYIAHRAMISRSDLGWKIYSVYGTEHTGYVIGTNCIAELTK